MAGAFALRAHTIKQAVLFTIHPDLDYFQKIARGLSLDPEFIPGSAPECGHSLRQSGVQSELIGITHDQYFTRVRILGDCRYDSLATCGDLGEFGKIERQNAALLQFFMTHKPSIINPLLRFNDEMHFRVV